MLKLDKYIPPHVGGGRPDFGRLGVVVPCLGAREVLAPFHPFETSPVHFEF
jgi:hypothetical protein